MTGARRTPRWPGIVATIVGALGMLWALVLYWLATLCPMPFLAACKPVNYGPMLTVLIPSLGMVIGGLVAVTYASRSTS